MKKPEQRESQLEDQVSPKRCDHMEGKQLISKEEMVAKIRTAVYAKENLDTLLVTRTDAIVVNGFEGAIDRTIAYRWLVRMSSSMRWVLAS